MGCDEHRGQRAPRARVSARKAVQPVDHDARHLVRDNPRLPVERFQQPVLPRPVPGGDHQCSTFRRHCELRLGACDLGPLPIRRRKLHPGQLLRRPQRHHRQDVPLPGGRACHRVHDPRAGAGAALRRRAGRSGGLPPRAEHEPGRRHGHQGRLRRADRPRGPDDQRRPRPADPFLTGRLHSRREREPKRGFDGSARG